MSSQLYHTKQPAYHFTSPAEEPTVEHHEEASSPVARGILSSPAIHISYIDMPETTAHDDDDDTSLPTSPASAPFEFARQHEVASLMAAMHQSLSTKLATQLAKQAHKQRETRLSMQKKIRKSRPSDIAISASNETAALPSPGCLAPPDMAYTKGDRQRTRTFKTRERSMSMSSEKSMDITISNGPSQLGYTVGNGIQAVPRSPLLYSGYDTAEDTDSDVEPLCRTEQSNWASCDDSDEEENYYEERGSYEDVDYEGMDYEVGDFEGVIFDKSPNTYVNSDWEAGLSAVSRSEAHGAPWEGEEERGRTLTRW